MQLVAVCRKRIVSWFILKNNLYAEIIRTQKLPSEPKDVRRGELSRKSTQTASQKKQGKEDFEQKRRNKMAIF